MSQSRSALRLTGYNNSSRRVCVPSIARCAGCRYRSERPQQNINMTFHQFDLTSILGVVDVPFQQTNHSACTVICVCYLPPHVPGPILQPDGGT